MVVFENRYNLKEHTHKKKIGSTGYRDRTFVMKE